MKSALLLSLLPVAVLLHLVFTIHAIPISAPMDTKQHLAFDNIIQKPRAKKFYSDYPAEGGMLLPYMSRDGFLSPFPSGLSDKWAGYLAAEQFSASAPNKRTEGHFLEPSAWMPLGEPGRFEWNFNRLR